MIGLHDLEPAARVKEEWAGWHVWHRPTIRFLAAGPDRRIVFAYSAGGYDSLCGSTVTRLYFPSIQRGMSFL